MAVYPLYPIMASVGDDETLRLWDLNQKQMILNKSLGTQATSLQFSPDGGYLVVGLINGVMLVLDSKIEKRNFGNYSQQYDLPSLEVVMSPKAAKASIVAMKFSFSGEFLAVSFNNEYNEEQIREEQAKSRMNINDLDGANHGGGKRGKDQDIGSREPSFVLVYVNRQSIKNPGYKLNSEEPYVEFSKIVLPLAEYQSSPYIRSLLAVTSLDFSQEADFLQMIV